MKENEENELISKIIIDREVNSLKATAFPRGLTFFRPINSISIYNDSFMPDTTVVAVVVVVVLVARV